MGLEKIKLGGVNWIHLAWDRERHWASGNAVMNIRVPYLAKRTANFSRRTFPHGGIYPRL
jgi:hypothetical protein